MEYVSKGNLDDDEDKNGEMYVILNNDDENIENSPINLEEDSFFDTRNNGFIRNSSFNTDKEINFNEINSEFNHFKSNNSKEDNKENLIDDIKENSIYNDIFFWDKTRNVPSNMKFLDEI